MRLEDTFPDCERGTTLKLRAPGGACEGAEPDTCSRTDGDPHLETFDGYKYDLQLVGEFVAARS